MKFKLISESDVKVLREARKILKKLQKKENKLNEREDEAVNEVNDNALDSAPATLEHMFKHWQLLDELDAVHVDINADNTLSLNV